MNIITHFPHTNSISNDLKLSSQNHIENNGGNIRKMKATGIVRRIDDLGRIVIPKEIRRTLRFRESDPIEIFTGGEGEIVLKKYSPIGELGEFARQYAESLAQTTGHIICVTDRDHVIAVSGGDRKNLLGKAISRGLENAIEKRNNIIAKSSDKEFVDITSDAKANEEDYSQQAVSPILCEGDAIGAVIITDKQNKSEFGDVEQKLAHSAANFLGKQMES